MKLTSESTGAIGASTPNNEIINPVANGETPAKQGSENNVVRLPRKRKFKFMVGPSANNKFFNAKELTEEDLIGLFADHRETDKKDGLCFVPAVWAGERRHAQSVTHVNFLVYDIDGGMTVDEIEAILDAHRAKAIAYSTFSHMIPYSMIKVDAYEKWAVRAGEPEDPTDDSMKSFLASVKKDHLQNVKFDLERDHTKDGIQYRLEHDPIAKVRIVFPLEKPIEIVKLARTTKDAIEV